MRYSERIARSGGRAAFKALVAGRRGSNDFSNESVYVRVRSVVSSVLVWERRRWIC